MAVAADEATDAIATDTDVVVIGAGHNGLVAANYLADAGRDVVVLEAADAIGGMTSSAYPIPEAPRHMVNFHSADLLFWQKSPVADELRLADHGLRTIPVDPSYVYLHPDGASIAVWQDPRRTAEEIRRFSPRDADAYPEYARFLEGLGPPAAVGRRRGAHRHGGRGDPDLERPGRGCPAGRRPDDQRLGGGDRHLPPGRRARPDAAHRHAEPGAGEPGAAHPGQKFRHRGDEVRPGAVRGLG